MSLAGVDPLDPTPTARRQILFGVGPSVTGGDKRDVLIFANKTSAGTEVVETINTPIADETDCINRFGPRSEAYWLYWAYTQGDTAANIYIVAVAEAGGAAAGTCTFTFGSANTDTATGQANVTITWAGFTTSFVVLVGDTTAIQCAAFVAAINAADGGKWPFTATQGTTTATNVATVTTANLGDRGTYFLTPLLCSADTPTGNTIVKSSVTNGTGPDSFTNAYAAAATAGEFFYQVSPKSSITTVTVSDHGIGEHIFNINTQANATNGKDQTVYFGLVGTQAQGTTTTTSSGANSALAQFFRSKNSPWAPGMLAAFHAAIIRSAQIDHPSANLTGWTNTDSQVYIVPAPYSKSDWPSASEIKADLNNGICPVAFTTRGVPYLVRQITSRSLNASGSSDYRVREGHLPSAIFFTWEVLDQRYGDIKQPFIADDLKAGLKPLPKVTYPASVVALAKALVDDLTGATPLGLYVGPVLDPSQADYMKGSFLASKSTGNILFQGDFRAVEHNNGSSWLLKETSPSQ